MSARARWSVVAWCAAALGVGVVASLPESPYRPVALPGAGGDGPLAAVARAVGLDRFDTDALAFVGAAAMALSVGAFAWLLVDAHRRRVGPRAVLALAIAAQVSVLSLPLLLSRDAYSYAIYGRIEAVHGGDPYVDAPSAFPDDPFADVVSRRWIDTTTVYGPLFTRASAAMAGEIDGPGPLVGVFRVLAAAGAVATTLLLSPLARRIAPHREAVAIAAFGLNPVVLFHGVAGGHNDLLVSAGLAGGALLAVSGRRVGAALAVGAAALVKATAGIALVPLLIATATSSRRRAAWSIGSLVAAGTVIAWPYLTGGDPTLGLATLVGTEGWLAPSRLLRRGLDAISGGTLGVVVRVAFPLALTALVVAIARRIWRVRSGGVDELAGWGWSLLALALLGPMLLPWYAAWFVPLAFLLPGAGWRAAIGTSLLLAVSLFATEPAGADIAYDVNVLLGRWIITPLVIALAALAGREVLGRLRSGAALGASAEVQAGGGGRR